MKKKSILGRNPNFEFADYKSRDPQRTTARERKIKSERIHHSLRTPTNKTHQRYYFLRAQCSKSIFGFY